MSLWKFPPQHNPWYKMTGLQVEYTITVFTSIGSGCPHFFLFHFNFLLFRAQKKEPISRFLFSAPADFFINLILFFAAKLLYLSEA